MNRLFVDTNVLIDFLADRQPFSLDAAKIFNAAIKKEVQIYVSAVSFNNIYYILRQSHSHAKTLQMLAELNEWAQAVDVTKEIIGTSLKSDFKDFEDAIQYNCAKSIHKIEGIVTRNAKDFKKSTLPILTPHEALLFILRTKK